MSSELLVAVDGSKHSEKVVEVACQLAKDLSATIVLLYVMRRMPEELEGIKEFKESEHYEEEYAKPLSEIREDATARLSERTKSQNYEEAYARYLSDVGKEVTSKLGERIKNQNVFCEISTEFGNPVELILETAKLRKPRMIVMGLHGRRYAGRIRSLGSVARTVIENAPCQVLVVP